MPRGTVLWVSSIPSKTKRQTTLHRRRSIQRSMRRAWIPSWHKNWRDSTAFSRPQGFFTLNPWNFCYDLTTLPPCMGGPKERLNSGFPEISENVICMFCLWLFVDGWKTPLSPRMAYTAMFESPTCHAGHSRLLERHSEGRARRIYLRQKLSAKKMVPSSSQGGSLLTDHSVLFHPPTFTTSGKDLTIWLVNLQLILSWFLLGATSWHVLQAVKGLLLMSFLDLNWDFRREVVKEDELRWHCMVFHESDGTVIQGPP